MPISKIFLSIIRISKFSRPFLPTSPFRDSLEKYCPNIFFLCSRPDVQSLGLCTLEVERRTGKAVRLLERKGGAFTRAVSLSVWLALRPFSLAHSPSENSRSAIAPILYCRFCFPSDCPDGKRASGLQKEGRANFPFSSTFYWITVSDPTRCGENPVNIHPTGSNILKYNYSHLVDLIWRNRA